ncbi:hypothetical protein PFISCL1PPCAC_23366 [Pristionchus fissidentatus]|uniref:GYF domain-containing protein n=1 Tax=Pristionchus fissidentatus TaxID=1538716 RepID=A0AAV5WMW6_9BILA|nr:hypothetical protein PFISCL1PPCAC_23366 [Pristionchus fissidentatus]
MKDRIFFKEEDNLRGPFTERQVQEGYRKGWFESRPAQFHFTIEGGSSPVASSEWFSLEELRLRNGIGCPFKWIDRSINEEGEKRKREEESMKKIEETLAALRIECESVTKLEERIEKAEKAIENLPAHRPSTTAVSEKANTTANSEEREVAQLLDSFPQFAFALLEVLNLEVEYEGQKLKEFPFVGINDYLERMTRLVVGDDKRRKQFANVLNELLSALVCTACGSCGNVFFNAKQLILHFIDRDGIHSLQPVMVAPIEVIRTLMIDFLIEWKKEEEEVNSRGKNIATMVYRPTDEFAGQIEADIDHNRMKLLFDGGRMGRRAQGRSRTR